MCAGAGGNWSCDAGGPASRVHRIGRKPVPAPVQVTTALLNGCIDRPGNGPRSTLRPAASCFRHWSAALRFRTADPQKPRCQRWTAPSCFLSAIRSLHIGRPLFTRTRRLWAVSNAWLYLEVVGQHGRNDGGDCSRKEIEHVLVLIQPRLHPLWSKNSNVPDVTCCAPPPSLSFGPAALPWCDPQILAGEQLRLRLSFWTSRDLPGFQSQARRAATIDQSRERNWDFKPAAAGWFARFFNSRGSLA